METQIMAWRSSPTADARNSASSSVRVRRRLTISLATRLRELGALSWKRLSSTMDLRTAFQSPSSR